MKTSIVVCLVAGVALSLGGCTYDEGAPNADLAPPAPALESLEKAEFSPTFQSGPEQGWVVKAKSHFKNGEYGLAERYFRQAAEQRPANLEAWIGLAASYDHLKRFDLSDRVYDVLQKRVGNTPTVLNNLGYHYMLKGEFGSAEHALLTAQSLDPKNPLIIANLALLADWKAAAGRSG